MGKGTDRARELQSQLEETVSDLVTGEDWRAMLQVASKFHRYSAGNVILILRQCPEATRVAGFNTWKGMGRFVRKGEHGIWILAPCRYKTRDNETGEETGEDRWIVRGFTSVAVFDVAQTDGQDLLDMVRPELLEGEAPAGLWDALAKQIASAGFILTRGDCGTANGRTVWGARTVTVRSDVDDAQACKTLVHELAHILLGHEAAMFACQGVKEVEAESVAYVVSQACGMATSGYSLPYIGHGAGGDVTVVRQTAERVVKTAGAILAALEDTEPALVMS